jgi:hypothetical protein
MIPRPLTTARDLDDLLLAAGYANDHAPTPSEGWRVGTIAMRVREFDRDHGGLPYANRSSCGCYSHRRDGSDVRRCPRHCRRCAAAGAEPSDLRPPRQPVVASVNAQSAFTSSPA